jgi:DNA primase
MFNDPAKTAEAIRDLVKPLSVIRDELKRTLLIRNISQKFNLREKLLEKELEKILEAVKKTERIPERKPAEKKNGTQLQAEKIKNTQLLRTEKEIVALMFEGSGNVINYFMEHIKPEDFEDQVHSRIAAMVFDTYRNGEDIIASALISKFEDENIQKYIARITIEEYTLSKNWERMDPAHDGIKNLSKLAKDLVKKFKILQIEEKISAKTSRQLSVQTEDERAVIMTEISELRKKKLIIEKALGYNEEQNN